MTFMDSETFEMVTLPEDEVEKKDWVLEGMCVKLVENDGKIIDVILPMTHDYVVVETADVSTRKANDKAATLETGGKVTVPGFIKMGESVLCDVENGVYLSRSSSGKKSFT